MTDHDDFAPQPTAPGASACGFDIQRAAYLRGALDEAAAEAFEAHLAACASCETIVERETRLDLDRHAVTAPASVRGAVLERVATAPRSTGTFPPSRWMAGAALVAAALLVMVMRRAGDQATPSVIAVDTAAAAPVETLAIDTGLPEAGTPRNAMLGTAAKLARDPSLAEFRVLDEAARELEAALAETPTDRDVREQLDAVRARRAELTEKVKEAAS